MNQYLFPCVGGYDALRTQKEVNNVLIQDLITQYVPVAQRLWDLMNTEIDDIFDMAAAIEKQHTIIELTKALPTTTHNQRLVAHILYGELLLSTLDVKRVQESKFKFLLKSKENRDVFLNRLQFNIDYLIVRLQLDFIGSSRYLECLLEDDINDEEDQTLEEFEDSILNKVAKIPFESCIINELAIIGGQKAIKRCKEFIKRGYIPRGISKDTSEDLIIVPELMPLYAQDRKKRVFQLGLALICLNIPVYLVGDLANLMYQTDLILGCSKTIKIVEVLYTAKRNRYF